MKAFLKLGVLALTLTASIWAANISTGVAPVNGQTWMIGGNAATVVSGVPDLLAIWVAAPADSAWVSNSTNAVNPVSSGYVFTLNIGALFGGAGSFSGVFSSDNFVQFTIDGGGTVSPSGCTDEFCYEQTYAISGSFGANSVLTATLENIQGSAQGPNPMGLLVSATADVSGIPEPGTYAMMILGGAAIGLARLRRK